MEFNNELYENLIKYTTQFGLSKDLFQEIISNGKLITIKRNEKLLNIGEQSNYIYFIIEGGFVSQYLDENSSEYRTIAFFIENYQPFMTQPESFFTKSLSDCQLKAFKNSEVLAFHRDSIEKLSIQHKAFEAFCNARILEALILDSKMKSKIISLSKQNLYRYLIKDHSSITKNAPSKYIAEFMGITPQWLSKIKHVI